MHPLNRACINRDQVRNDIDEKKKMRKSTITASRRTYRVHETDPESWNPLEIFSSTTFDSSHETTDSCAFITTELCPVFVGIDKTRINS